MWTLPWDLNITEAVMHGEPRDECDQCAALALITVTWTPGDEAFGQLTTCFHPECLSWAIGKARNSARDNIITVEFARYQRHSPAILEVAA